MLPNNMCLGTEGRTSSFYQTAREVRKSEPVPSSVCQFGTPCPISNSVKPFNLNLTAIHQVLTIEIGAQINHKKDQIKLLLYTILFRAERREPQQFFKSKTKNVLRFSFCSFILKAHLSVKIDEKYDWRHKQTGDRSLAIGLASDSPKCILFIIWKTVHVKCSWISAK